MKNPVLSLIILCGSLFPMQAQDTSADALYAKYSSGDGVFAMSLSHEMLRDLDMDFDFEDQMKKLSGDIHQVKFISFLEKSSPEKKVKKISAELQSAGLATLPLPKEIAKEDLHFLQIFGEREEDHYKNIYMLLLSDDAETGLFIAVNGKLKIKKTS